MKKIGVLTPQRMQQRLLAWYHRQGRKNLPWQQRRSPYRVWLSEVMLQQTQVETVIPYFQRFIKVFPTLKKLANAPLDEVLKLWAGLGFYSRARNLHRTAQIVAQDYKGSFPHDLLLLQKLPGIGRSTAGAIFSLGLGKPAPILDGNVKRVLSRLHAIEGWSYTTSTLKQLWHLAETYTPHQHSAEYTQAIMDLGALICTPKTPHCDKCPLQTDCRAYAQGSPTRYPMPKPSKQIPTRSKQMVLLINQNGEVLLEKRPPSGIWGGLWSLPECAHDQDVVQWCKTNYRWQIHLQKKLAPFRHTFSHFHLMIHPVLATLQKRKRLSDQHIWHNLHKLDNIGIPAPIKKLLNTHAIGR